MSVFKITKVLLIAFSKSKRARESKFRSERTVPLFKIFDARIILYKISVVPVKGIIKRI